MLLFSGFLGVELWHGVGLRDWVFRRVNLGGVLVLGEPRVAWPGASRLVVSVKGHWTGWLGVRLLCGAWPCAAVIIWLAVASVSWLIGVGIGRISWSPGLARTVPGGLSKFFRKSDSARQFAVMD